MVDSFSIQPVALIPTKEGSIGRFKLSVPKTLVQSLLGHGSGSSLKEQPQERVREEHQTKNPPEGNHIGCSRERHSPDCLLKGARIDLQSLLPFCRFEARPLGGKSWDPVLDVRPLRSASKEQASDDGEAVYVSGALILPLRDRSVEVRVKLQSATSVAYVAQCTFPYVLSYDFNAVTEHPVNNKYAVWFAQHRASRKELAKQRQRAQELVGPTFSIVVPLYETPLPFLRDVLQSVLQQTYPAWQLILVNASPSNKELTAAVNRYAAHDKRIIVVEMVSNEGIVGNTNRGIQEATGDFIAFMDHDDILEPNILYEYARAVQEEPTCDFLYCDEDLFDKPGHYFAPLFKSEFNLDLLRTHNYITHMYAIRTSLLATLELPGKEMEGAQDYDLTFKATEKARYIAHIPQVLYHWRAHEKSTNIMPGSKPYAEEAGRKAVQAHLDRVYPGCTVQTGELTNTYTVVYPVTGNHMVSIIIPTRDQAPALKRCITSVLDNAGYEQFEIVIVENGSTQEETFALYEDLQKKDRRIRIVNFQQSGNGQRGKEQNKNAQHASAQVDHNQPRSEKATGKQSNSNLLTAGGPHECFAEDFNYSALINFGVKEAKGDYLFFLNNDVEAITKGFLKTLLGFALRPEVGVVGAKLLYPDETIQHAGVGVQFTNKKAEPAFHLFAHLPRGTHGYHDRAIKTQDYSAVTGACQMTPRSTFERVSGYDEAYAVAFNDVDYCLKVIEQGELVVYCAEVEFFHDESLSRGADNQDEEKQARASQERALLQERWGAYYKKGDPYLNPNYAPTSLYLKPIYGYSPGVLLAYAKRILHRTLIKIQGVLKKR